VYQKTQNGIFLPSSSHIPVWCV